jgi:rhodanese-related sulfurtransferase
MGLTEPQRKPRILRVGTSQTPGLPKMPGIQALLDLCAACAKESVAMAIQPQTSHSISAADLARSLGSAHHALVIDVRREPAFSASQHLICGSVHRPPETVGQWGPQLAGKQIVVRCVHGHEVGQNAASELRAAGFDARYLSGVPHLRKTTVYDGTRSTCWITRAWPKIDRIACSWLIRRFIDPHPLFPLCAGRSGSRRGQRQKRDPVRHSRRGVRPLIAARPVRSIP